MAALVGAVGSVREVLERQGVGDGFVACSCGGRHWGRFGAAGLLVVRAGTILLQHRAPFLQEGGTWALPGGALDVGEAPLAGALREAEEEAAVPPRSVRPRHAWTVDHGTWRYTTIIADATGPIDARDVDGEGLEVRWVPVAEVEQAALHSGFAAAWPHVRRLVELREIVLVDANLAEPAAARDSVPVAATHGLETPHPLVTTLPGRTWAWPRWEVSSRLASRAAGLIDHGWTVTVVSDDPGRRLELTALGARVVEATTLPPLPPQSSTTPARPPQPS